MSISLSYIRWRIVIHLNAISSLAKQKITVNYNLSPFFLSFFFNGENKYCFLTLSYKKIRIGVLNYAWSRNCINLNVGNKLVVNTPYSIFRLNLFDRTFLGFFFTSIFF